MTGYYYLVASLPVLALENESQKIDPYDLFNYIRENLDTEDLPFFNQILHLNDIKNLVRMIADTHRLPLPHPEFETFSSLPEETINEYHYRLDEMPGFIQNIIEQYDGKFGELDMHEMENLFLKAYYDFLSQSKNSFIRSFAKFDLKLRNVFTAVNCKKHGYSLEKMLIEDGEISQQLIRSSAKDFGLSGQLPYITRLIELSENASVPELKLFIDQLRWQYASELTSGSFFSIDNLLAYLIQLEVLMKRKIANVEQGKERLDNLIDQAMKQLEIPV
jgi:vacuolar-type H+-ATPase subunit C/Vma6